MRDHELNVYNVPSEVDESELHYGVAIVIDLLRATTTICCALAAGASEVVPFRTIEETLAATEKVGRGRVVLGGERGGQQIEGFDLGNSPSEYTPAAVVYRPVYITTTNGTLALWHARLARRVLVGAIVNLSAVSETVKDDRRVNILCAGTDGVETREDILAAGAFVHRICELSSADWQMNVAAQAARDQWADLHNAAAAARRSLHEQLAIELHDTPGGRNLIKVGLERDLADCSQIDRLSFVPELNAATGRIRVPLEVIQKEFERGKTESAEDISRGSPRLFWQTRGAWGQLMTRLFDKRFSVTVEHISDITCAEKESFEDGYNSVTRDYIEEKFGGGSFRAAMDQVEHYRRESYRKYLESRNSDRK